MYSHFTAAHESTGLHAITLDEYLIQFISEYMERFDDH